MDTLSNSQLITLLVVLVCGAAGTYLLLPHAHGQVRPRIVQGVGLGLSALALLGFAGFWTVGEVDLMTRIAFYLFAFISVACALLTITSRDPVHSALWFAAVVLATSGLFLLSGAQFLAAGTVIVYAGAIIVTFLFVIMLAQKEGRAVYDRMARAPFLATISSFLILAGVLIPLIGMNPKPSEAGGVPSMTLAHSDKRLIPLIGRIGDPVHPEQASETLPRHRLILDRSMTLRSRLPETIDANPARQPSHVASLGASLFTDHLLVVELAGSLLFVALIGALAIATPKPPIRPASMTTNAPNATSTSRETQNIA